MNPWERIHRLRALDARESAMLFTELERMESAGIPAARGLRTLAGDGRSPLGARARLVAASVAKGRPVHEAGERAGLFSALEADVLRAAAAGGHLQAACSRLAEWHTDRWRHARRMKARLILPAAVFALVMFVSPLPDLIGGAIGAGEYLWRSAGRVAIAAMAIFLLLRAPAWLRGGAAGDGVVEAIDRLVLRIPVLGKAQVRRSVSTFLEILGLLIEAGVPIHEAAVRAVESVPNRVVRRDLGSVAADLAAGRTLATACRAAVYLDETSIQLIDTGEQAGKLPEMLGHHARGERAEYRAMESEIAAWVPRLVYFALIAWLGASVLSGGGAAFGVAG